LSCEGEPGIEGGQLGCDRIQRARGWESVHQELCDRGVQMNTNSAGNKVEEGTHLAVKRGGPDRFHRINCNGVPLHGDSLNISTGERSVNFVPEF